jgi:hypothetical protein
MCYKLVKAVRKSLFILAIFLTIVNIGTIYFTLVSNESKSAAAQQDGQSADRCPPGAKCVNSHRFPITVILRDFEAFDNDVGATVQNISSADAEVVIMSDSLPYPPLAFNTTHAHLLLLQPSLSLSHLFSYNQLQCMVGESSYVFIVPDAVRCVGRCFQNAIMFFERQAQVNPSISMAAFPIFHSSSAKSALGCLSLEIDIKRWTLRYGRLPSNNTVCDAVSAEDFVVLLKSDTLFSFPSPFLRPLKTTVFIHNVLRRLKVAIEREASVKFMQSRALFESDAHYRWKHKRLEHDRLKTSYAAMGIKLVTKPEGRDEWYGCGKDTERCFGTVVNDMPDYIYNGRWTPPCCLRALRQTAKYVFRVLESQNVRYWLEGGTLLGAMRNGDIIPWDYDIDIGIYKDDIDRSEYLAFCRDKQQPYIDAEGYVWEKAREGDFFRVQYSETNHLHVDIFPFFSRNGTMTKYTWFKTHRQDMEFPESYLKPLDKIPFVGVKAFAPNNAKEFLELKFGAGVIENPRFPNNNLVV